MQDFTFYNPTKILFGKSSIEKIASEIPQDARILITYGGGSVIENGTMERVRNTLQGYNSIEFGGIEPNPTYETLMKAVHIARKQNISFMLAVGGGSVIDGTKFIAAAACFKGEDPWDILAKQAPIEDAIPFGTVLTLPATGSEMNCGAVVSRTELKAKLVFMSPLVFPRFSALDPQTTMSLPLRQTANGVVDAFIHTLEQYLTYPVNAAVQDRFAEGLLCTLIENGNNVLKTPNDYDVRANIMLAASMALNGLIAMGVPEDWATHLIGHEITAVYGTDHARTLAVVLFGVLAVRREQKRAKLLQYAERVWNITEGSEDERIDAAITKTREFFEHLGIGTRLADYDIAGHDIPTIIESLTKHGRTALGEWQDIDPSESERILQATL